MAGQHAVAFVLWQEQLGGGGLTDHASKHLQLGQSQTQLHQEATEDVQKAASKQPTPASVNHRPRIKNGDKQASRQRGRQAGHVQPGLDQRQDDSLRGQRTPRQVRLCPLQFECPLQQSPVELTRQPARLHRQRRA